MMATRREVLRWITATAAGGALLAASRGIVHALVQRTSSAPLVWINDGDHLNLLTLLGQHTPDFLELVSTEWNLRDYDPLRPAGFQASAEAYAAAPVVILEAVPPAEAMAAPGASAVAALVTKAKTAILLGTDACYGVYTDKARIQAFEKFCKQQKTPLIKLPGIPVPPQHLIGILGYLEFFGFPELDAERRPVLYYAETLCEHCEFRADLALGRFANAFGEPGCLLELGCKGPITHNTCSRSKWNNRENWCVGAGAPCTGCSEPSFPDHEGVGLSGVLRGSRLGDGTGYARHVEGIGKGLLALAVIAVGIKGLRRWLARGAAAETD